MTTTTRKPAQDYRAAYRMKDGKVFVARCSTAFYGTTTPGWILGADGRVKAQCDISNADIAEPLGQYALVAYYNGEAVGISSHAISPKRRSEMKAPIKLFRYPVDGGGAVEFATLTRSEFGRKVKLVWEPVETL